MFRLAVVTCVVLGAALAMPPPSADRPAELGNELGSYSDPEPIPFLKDGDRAIYMMPPPAKPSEDADQLGAYSDPEPISFLEDEERVTYALPPPAKPSEDAEELGDPEPIPFLQDGERAAVYTLPTGRYYFTSPYHPSNYVNNYDASFTVIGDSDQDITITCSPFNMEAHSSCGWDYLSINGVKYCGTSGPPTITTFELRVRIFTDVSVVRSGFYCLVTVVPPPAPICFCGQSQTRVVGGTAATLGQFPWQAGIVQTGGTRTFCGGSVISNRYVLTAAHCTVSFAPSQIQVMLGDLNIGPTDVGEKRFSVQQILRHPSYTSATGSGWDFSLLRLDRDIVFSTYIQPVCMPLAGQTYADATAIASGYGRTGAGLPQATTLQHVQVPVWSQSRCSGTWGSFLKSNMICAGGYPTGGRSVCNGDSGGPLVTEVSGRFRLIGVVSFGSPCALANIPDVYARVTEALSWITANAANTCSPP